MPQGPPIGAGHAVGVTIAAGVTIAVLVLGMVTKTTEELDSSEEILVEVAMTALELEGKMVELEIVKTLDDDEGLAMTPVLGLVIS